MAGPITSTLFDEEGSASIEAVLSAIADTDFAQEGLRTALTSTDQVEIESWRVGEAIADVYLTHHRSCFFPWPPGRDSRKRQSSLPGADLVGFVNDKNGDCLAFGEVKTSSDNRYPPRSMYGPTGLKKQLEDLRDSESLRDSLLLYLTHRVHGASWRRRFEGASRRYLQNKSDVHLYGVLIRDVKPHPSDIRSRIDSLSNDCPSEMQIELLALYLPKCSIDELGTAAVNQRRRSDA